MTGVTYAASNLTTELQRIAARRGHEARAQWSRFGCMPVVARRHQEPQLQAPLLLRRLLSEARSSVVVATVRQRANRPAKRRMQRSGSGSSGRLGGARAASPHRRRACLGPDDGSRRGCCAWVIQGGRRNRPTVKLHGLNVRTSAALAPS